MVTIGMNYKILSGKEEIFENAFKNVLKVMSDMEGHTTSALYRDVNDAQNYLITSDWNSEEAYNDFINSDRFKGVVSWVDSSNDEPTLSELNSGLGTDASDINNSAIFVGSTNQKTFYVVKVLDGGTLADFVGVEATSFA